MSATTTLLNIAHTSPINPPNTSPALTQSQVWAGLQRKVKRGQDFVPVITSCEVIEEGVTNKERFPGLIPGIPFIIREATFREGAGPALAQKNGGKMRETCVLYAPNRVEFLGTDGSYVCNTISIGAQGRRPASEGGDDLQMTYSFSWILSDELSEEELQKRRLDGEPGAKMAVDSSIQAMREMVKDGRIGS